MAYEFPLPDVGEGLAEAEIVHWLVAPGGSVKEDDPIVEIETDKALVQITSPVTGTVIELGAEEGEVLAVGQMLAIFAPADGSDPQSTAPAAPGIEPTSAEPTSGEPATEPVGARTTRPATPASAGERSARKPRATPATRKFARKLGVDLADVEPTGPGGRIIDADVQRIAEGATAAASTAPAGSRPRTFTAPAGEADERVPMRGIRRATARTMMASWQQVPHVNSIHEVDFEPLQRLRRDLQVRGRSIPLTAFLVRATATALREYPTLNASVDAEREEIILRGRRNIGVSVSTPDGLIVPVIHDADRRSVEEIGSLLRELAGQARDRTLPAERLQGGTFTVNNYGPLGGWFGTSLVKPPEAGILSFGPVIDRVVPRDGEIVIRPVGVMTLAADHRVADGEETIGLCLAIRRLLEAPVGLLLED